MSVPCLVENDALADWAAWDESLGWVMEDPDPVMDQPPTETPASPKPTITELKATIDARVRLAAEPISRARRLTGRWRGRLCRVVGIGCYGLEILCWAKLQRHLRSKPHLRHEEALAAARVETAQQVAVVEDGGLPAERAMNSAHSAVGDGDEEALPKQNVHGYAQMR
ncbi:hypothetical protein FPSE_09514 [Fusarium pseudograminearum CS3096]|uniref:Uncharacterized protein n=1 Tax=Fusarium pseudograminearum (strain CS3096) TaxID=1028729 RepID=K3V9I7_FUSPC|nr:hypothetical protein FPSE_09514 [Fusarium pseudograminearum CS3096]EKJ70297.1 hypothetical protein FPSE_09514 [Fusarium pseudograminearum CS3096]